ncbi:hypothetical protein QQS21_012274 [Conoideocrella luteorostrata]|uniref:Uncharacterized protein n=1 Tax=Conoideocrella luteorostrata TaxID=1105319 RepID=A0AAJ0CG07_9HYPO|nr:hypothetical protein QQS21_012274 [Conoideocrella luteorostrata]
MFPSTPSLLDTDIVSKPFLDACEERHATLDGCVKPKIPANGKIDGYIKAQFLLTLDQDVTSSALFSLSSKPGEGRNQGRLSRKDQILKEMSIPPLPPNFATGLELDAIDRKLWTFHLQAYCPGRTLLPENYWMDELVPIAVGNDCTRHALLSFPTSYALDYHPTEEMRKRANLHYETAVHLISSGCTLSIGKLEGLKVNSLFGELVRDQHAQFWIAQTLVTVTIPREMSRVLVTLLEDKHITESFQWLLEGTWLEARRIHNITGLCPKLLHIFAQVTHISGRLAKMPDPEDVLISSAKRIQSHLSNLRHWSTSSAWYGSVQELFDSCLLGTGESVNDLVKVTELTAQSYISATEIYLHCRFLRKPRSHLDVLANIGNLATCKQRMLCTGPLFTSQSPFPAILILSAAAYLPEHRIVAQNWFEVVLKGVQCRSRVPSVLSSIQKLWEWMENKFLDASFPETQSVNEREP